jgi:glycerophosphoryl diester phosphodiesterase
VGSLRPLLLLCLLVAPAACRCWPPPQPSGQLPCAFQPRTELNLYRTQVVYRLLQAQNSLISGSPESLDAESYDSDAIREGVTRLFLTVESGAVDGPWWPIFREEFDAFWSRLARLDTRLAGREWVARNFDLISTAHAFEILSPETERRVIETLGFLDRTSRRVEVATLWADLASTRPTIENPRIDELDALEFAPTSPFQWRDGLREGRSLVLAHRGGYSAFPENSLAAFRGAYARGVDGVECDLRLSADGEVFVVHSESLAGSAMVPERVSNLASRRLLRLRLRDPMTLRSPSCEGPLRLETLLRELGGRFLLWLELKPDGGDALPSRVGDLLEELDLVDEVVVSSFSESMVRPLRERFAELYIAYEYAEPAEEAWAELENAEDRRRIIVSVDQRHVESDAFVRLLGARRVKSSVYTPNRYDALTSAILGGVDFIQTDRPERAFLLMKER